MSSGNREGIESRGKRSRPDSGVGKEVTQCLLGHSTLDPLRRIFSGHVSPRLSRLRNQFRKTPKKIFNDGSRLIWPKYHKWPILSNGIGQTLWYNRRYNDVASPHRSITAAPERRGQRPLWCSTITTGYVPTAFYATCFFLFLILNCYSLYGLYMYLSLSFLRATSNRCFSLKLKNARELWSENCSSDVC